MQPLPTNPEPLGSHADGAVIGQPRTLELGPSKPVTNQRRSACAIQRSYPWLLTASTGLAAVFCYLYLTKPVIGTAPAAPVAAAQESQPTEAPASITPAKAAPQEIPNRTAAVEPQGLALSTDGNPFEETNLRIQHVLGATGPENQDLGRITLDVPVLYQSGGVHWTRGDVTKARALLARLEDYQLKSRSLREEAVTLISEWDALILVSIPESTLRADSPTLPENQGVGSANAAPLKSTEAVEINAR